jgi:hypothetical protein
MKFVAGKWLTPLFGEASEVGDDEFFVAASGDLL